MRTLPLLLLALTACSSGEDTVASGPRTELQVELRASAEAELQRWTLTCEPAGGDHPDPAQACEDLAREREPFAPVPPGSVCTEIYGGPQTATVRGTYRGQPVSLDLKRTDGCTTAQWDRLGAVLPATP